MMGNPGKQKKIRKVIQALSAVISNANIPGFINGTIYKGPLKRFCVPGMNCYSCPGALGSCPIGSMQALFGARHPRLALYVVGFLGVIGILVGRFVCGWLCLFGLIQELLYKIPVKKISVPEKLDKALRKLKYVFLAIFVVLFPIILRDEFGVGIPYFCELICPVGTLEGGVPLVILNEGLRAAAHWLYVWKLFILLVILLLSVLINRPFCKYICPLGAFYGLFQKVSFLQLRCDKNTCISCGACARTCRMQVDPSRNPSSAECIRCGECVSICPVDALSMSFRKKSTAADRKGTTK